MMVFLISERRTITIVYVNGAYSIQSRYSQLKTGKEQSVIFQEIYMQIA